MLHGRFVHIRKTLTDLQILGRDLHQNSKTGCDGMGMCCEKKTLIG